MHDNSSSISTPFVVRKPRKSFLPALRSAKFAARIRRWGLEHKTDFISRQEQLRRSL
jgi:hypothetical protein